MYRVGRRYLLRARAQGYLRGPLLAAVTLISVSPHWADTPEDVTEPQLSSMFPSAGRPDTTVQAEVRGHLIEGAYAVWFDDEGLGGRVLKVEEVREPVTGEKNDPPGKAPENSSRLYCVSIEVRIGPKARQDRHSLRLIAPRGLSNALPFRVTEERLVVEASNPHQDVNQAQPVTLPVLIDGRLEKPGELDYYSFEAKQGQQVYFQFVSAENFDPHLALYRAGGSWFDPDRPTRLRLEQDWSSDLMPVKVGGSYRAPQTGRYFLEVSSVFGKGSPDSSYQLRMAPQKGKRPTEEDPAQSLAPWQERSFERRLERDWARTLEARSVHTPESAALEVNAGVTGQKAETASGTHQEQAGTPTVPASLSTVVEREPNDRAVQAQELSIPALIEGAIERPGDMDSFKFKVQPGQKLVFEIETPELKPPLFNPRLGVVDREDREMFSNVHRRISLFNNNADRQVYLKGVEPKAVYTFERGGEYVLQVRDITSRYGGPAYRYRVLVRPPVPHVGEVSVGEPDRINLRRGLARKLTITTSHEEGFTGEVSFSFAGLPQGVQAFPAAELNEGRAPTDVDENAEAVAPKIQKTTLVLLADQKAPLTSMPKAVQLYCRPIAGGHPGSLLLVREIPVMVIEAAQEKPEERPRSGR